MGLFNFRRAADATKRAYKSLRVELDTIQQEEKL